MTVRRGVERVALVMWLVLAAIVAVDSTPAKAQSLNLTAGDDGGPVNIFAEDGIEWQQESLVFLARGNARAVRDDVEVNADVLKAYYHDVEGNSEIWRLDAEGSVVIESPNERVTGDLAIYDVPKGVLVVRGKDIRFTAGPDIITAEQQLEYWESKQLAVARGNAHAVRPGKQLDADVLAAYFKRQANGESDVERVEAFDNVRIKTATELVTANRGIYMVQTGLATLTGNVRITRGGNVVTGCKATVNLNTGISRMFACADGSGTRVQGSIVPEKTEETTQ